MPLSLMTDAQRDAFESAEPSAVWLEVGSRAMQRIVVGTDGALGGWLIVQPERYRYHAFLGSGIDMRIVLHEYLACCVHWKY